MKNELTKLGNLVIVTHKENAMGRWRVKWGTTPQAEGASKLLEPGEKHAAWLPPQTSEGGNQ